MSDPRIKELQKLLIHFYEVSGTGQTSAVGIADALRAIDSFKETHAGQLDSQLEHYLQRRSYDKALAWISNPDMPHTP
ncbi:MAG: hypothetical protein SGI71_01025 [Verrucomicrobiota bacterium]|nr:hypothetical protein [Verrucomicrobiota bacterium]